MKINDYTNILAQTGSSIPNTASSYPTYPVTTTNVNLQADPEILEQIKRIAAALELIVQKMGEGFA